MQTESEKMLDVTFYRDAVLEIILCGDHIPREVCELRLDLFLRAADIDMNNDNRERLEPFPSCFFDGATKERRYDDLSVCIESMPNLRDIKENTSLPEMTWMLLHWIFTNPLKIKEEKESPVSEVFTEDIREETKLITIPSPSNYCIRFEITHPIEINSTRVFLQHKGLLGSFYAFHGSPVYNFHSIIHRGLRCSLNVRSAHGPGTYLSSNLETAKSYAQDYSALTKFSRRPPTVDGIRYCIAIVEVIKHPSIKVVQFGTHANLNLPETSKFDDTSSNQCRYYIVNSDELMRLKHLLVFY